MNSLSAIFFPNTRLSSAYHFPLLLAFTPCRYLIAVEDDPANQQDIFIESGFCQAIVAPPLGDDRARFLHLVNDIQQRKDSYSSQLSLLTLASLSRDERHVSESERKLISHLVDDSTPSKKTSEAPQHEKLWQSRLLLKIAEILDSEEEEIAKELFELDENKAALIRQLTGDMDDEEAASLVDEAEGLQRHINAPVRSAVKYRTRAWAELIPFSDIQDEKIWCTAFSDAGDMILENYESAQGLPAAQLCSLPLPAAIGWQKETALEHIKRFHDEKTALVEQLAKILREDLFDEFSSLVLAWEDATNQLFPAEEFGRRWLKIYNVQPFSCDDLLQKRPQKNGSSARFLAVLTE